MTYFVSFFETKGMQQTLFTVIPVYCFSTGPEGYIFFISWIPFLASVGALSANSLLMANYTPLHSYLRSSIMEGSDDMLYPILALAVI